MSFVEKLRLLDIYRLNRVREVYIIEEGKKYVATC